ncbi:uncharacterized protein PHACADRAFT_130960 [Phanerochaete carnosa HHB-10118-sp]|uniref:Uncharacterized protein n=1 Tax=Phanerochaete carnosa (strain HHB-10118-sp) TaxID=650164 RepID=K5UKT7_PHACS|nr:uncharacterized protein PHACADRAFT_130960 [Phanerochaete carnosa HHB-10118-sp]EKM50261.1 hypothetical protein PHACADRAFT_130960 [Phanerochaete carnosa HHB-10118-sp]
MIRRPRSESIAQRPAAAASAPAKQGKASTKTAPDEEDKIDEAEAEDEDKEVDEEDAGEEGSEGGKPERKAYELVGSGPNVCYLWADGISSLLELDEDRAYVVLKSAALDAFRPVAGLPKDERFEAIEKHLDILRTWSIDATDEAREAPAAQALVKEWNEKTGKNDEEEDEDEDGDGEDDEDGGKGVQWWYEVTLQQERPKDDTSHIEVTLEDAGIWYLTDIKPADKEGDTAMSVVVDHTAHTYD